MLLLKGTFFVVFIYQNIRKKLYNSKKHKNFKIFQMQLKHKRRRKKGDFFRTNRSLTYPKHFIIPQ